MAAGHTIGAMRPVLLSLPLLLLAGCGGPPPPTTTAPPSSHPSASASPSAQASAAPDVDRIDVVSSGVGSYQLVAVPVAVLHNAAVRTAATAVIVHFIPTRGGQPLTPLASSAVIVYPGQSLVVTANCTDTCNNADGATVSVAVGAWTAIPGGPITTSGPVYACGGGCGGHGYGDVTATVQGTNLAQGMRVDLFAGCMDGSGRIVGGGERQLTWPQPGGSLSLDVPVILSAQPSSCQVAASAAA